VGCKWSDNIVYRDESFEGNPDGDNPKFNTKFGMYKPNIGLENLMLSWGHDVSTERSPRYLFKSLKTFISGIYVSSVEAQ
jgi:hypothetical protein